VRPVFSRPLPRTISDIPDSPKTGYEISFTRYFYKPQPLRTLEEIRADILALEKETEGLLGEIIGGKV
jgi:type I restriction enzyme M protein